MADWEEIIDDEVLIAFVKENRVLYDKKHRDYKNHEVKKDVWNMIQKAYGTLSAEELESRWNQLRNQFGKKLRERKTKPASGSGGGPTAKKVEWHLMGAMSFLMPYIAHRKGRSSVGNLRSATSPISPRASSPISLPSPVTSPTIEQWIDSMNNLATAVHKSISESTTLEIDKQKHKNPYAETIHVAFNQVPVAQQMDCLIAILNTIKTYQNA